MDLVLGTAQFGLAYGVAGRGVPVPPDEVRLMLRRAHARGIRWLDTAAAYGDIEERLCLLIDDNNEFSIVSKIPPLPTNIGKSQAAEWVIANLRRSHRRLGASLAAILFHRAEDLLESSGDILWSAASEFCAPKGIDVGVSCYAPAALASVASRYPVRIAQLPGNAFDQRIVQNGMRGVSDGITIHLRSVFLQGLLLMPLAEARARVPVASAALEHWHTWCRDRGVSPLIAALGMIKGLTRISHCVVGADSIHQLESIVDAWEVAEPLRAPELAQDSLAVIDPRQWPKRS